MNNAALLITVLCCLLSNAQSTTDAKLVQQVIEKYKTHNTMSYEVDYMIKYFDENEPFKVRTQVMSERLVNDTVFNGKFLYTRMDSLAHVTKYYDGTTLHLIVHDQQKIIRYDAQQGHTSPITGSADGAVIQVFFLDLPRIQKALDNDKIVKTYTDSLTHLVVRFQFPDDENYHDQHRNMYFNKKDKTLDKITDLARYKDQVQRNSWDLSNIIFDNITAATFDSRTQLHFENYALENYKPRTAEDYKLLENGELAPVITGKMFPDYQNDMILASDKIVILDFWYTACMPCIESIPGLNVLQEKYKKDVQVIGVHPFETKETQKDRITAFLARTPMHYPILFIDEIPKEYNVMAYPTIYIIDRDGKVAFSEIGSSVTLQEQMEVVIQELISKK
jgi:thiol-disulfide isomerase/thioredoxin